MPAGRPTSFTEDLKSLCLDYIENCPDIVPSVVGLCLHINISKSTAYKWAEDEEHQFSDILRTVNALQESALINKGLEGTYNSTITKLILTKHGYTDKVEQDVTSGGKPLNTWTVQPVTIKKD